MNSGLNASSAKLSDALDLELPDSESRYAFSGNVFVYRK